MSEPPYLAQAKLDSTDLVMPWLQRRLAEAKADGCKHFRATSDEKTGLVLLEGWTERPDDEGLPRWQTVSG